MGSMRNWMLGAAVVAGGLGMGATTAQAAEFGVYVQGPAAYVPRCPGPGYVWTAGYMANGYWVPGQWQYVGASYGYGDDNGYGNGYGYGDDNRYQYYNREDGWGHDRGWHRGWDRGYDRGGDRGRGWDRGGDDD